MITKTTDIVVAAKEYVQKGYNVIPINRKRPANFITEVVDEVEKKVSKGWEKSNILLNDIDEIFTHEYLGLSKSVPINIGIINSKNNLLDIDLDCDESRLLAAYYLPVTDCIFGRTTSISSHWLYSSSGSKYIKFSYLKDPQSKETNNDVTILELRPLNGSGFMTVFPPSTHHPTKEPITFSPSKDGSPTKISFEELEASCTRLAVASLISSYLDEGIRQDLVLALTGTLLKIDWNREEIITFIDPILKIFDDREDYRTRLQGIEQTINKFKNNKPVTGLTKLKELLPDHIFQRLKVWLGISKIEFPIFEFSSSLYFRRYTSKGVSNERLTSFSIFPKKSIFVPEDGTYLECTLQTESGRKFEITFQPDSFDSSSKFKKTLSRFGNEHTVYLGNDVQASLIKEFLSMESKDEVLGSRTSGFNSVNINSEKRLFFITEEGGLTYNNKIKSIEYSDNVSFINDLKSDCKLVSVSSPYQDEIDEIKKYIFDFNDPEIVQAILGWTVACFFKDYFISDPKLEGFPILFISGGSGSGKSKTAKNIINNIWGIESKLKSFIEQSNFTLVKYMGSSNNIPIIFDEAKLNRMGKIKKDVFSNLIRTAYDNSIANKGRQDQTMVHYPYSRPLALCSETGLNESAHLDRTIFVNFSIIKSRKHKDSFMKLSSMDLSILGRALIDYNLTTSHEKIRNNLYNTLGKIPPLFEDRPKVCLCAVSFGLKILSEIFNVEIQPTELFDKQSEHYYLESGITGERISEVDKTLVTWCLMCKYSGESAHSGTFTYDVHLDPNDHYMIKDENRLCLHINSIFPLFRKWDKIYEHQGDLLDQRTFLQQVKEESYYIDHNKLIKMGNKPQRCLILDIEKMRNKGLELFFPWINEKLGEDGE